MKHAFRPLPRDGAIAVQDKVYTASPISPYSKTQAHVSSRIAFDRVINGVLFQAAHRIDDTLASFRHRFGTKSTYTCCRRTRLSRQDGVPVLRGRGPWTMVCFATTRRLVRPQRRNGVLIMLAERKRLRTR